MWQVDIALFQTLNATATTPAWVVELARLASAVLPGLLLAALIDPVFPAAVRNGWDAALAAAALLALGLKLPPWAVVVACGAIAALLHL